MRKIKVGLLVTGFPTLNLKAAEESAGEILGKLEDMGVMRSGSTAS